MKSLLGSALGLVYGAILETAINYQLGYRATNWTMVKSCRVKSIHFVHWNCTTSKCGKSRSAPGWRRSLKRQSSSVQAPNGILPKKVGSIGGTPDNQRFPGQKMWRFDPQRWEAWNSAEMEVCFTKNWDLPLINICQKIVKHQAVWNGASPIAWGYHSVWDPLL